MFLPLASLSDTAIASVVAALVTGFFAWFVQAWRYRREASDQALQVLRQNRDPLLRAAFELQSRLYNVVAKDFLVRYRGAGTEEEKEYARWSTLWLFGQYLGWTEILRREIQYLDLGSKAANRAVQRRLNEVAAALASDAGGGDSKFIVFRSDQRAIGEFMVTERTTQSGERPDCLGYSEFIGSVARLERHAETSQPQPEDTPVASWIRRFTLDVDGAAAAAFGDPQWGRLVRVQRRLIDLIDLLDPDRLRYPRLDSRGKLPNVGAVKPPRADQVASFIWLWGDPWGEVDACAAHRHLECHSQNGNERSYRGRRGPLGGRPELCVAYEDGWLTICARTVRGKKLIDLDGSLRARRTRLALNDLLSRFDRPLIAD